MIHYCAHPTAAGINPEITRDWPGPMVDMLERESGCITTFFNGSVGETGPNLPNGQTMGTYEMAIELGNVAGMDAVRAWRSIKEWISVSLDLVVDDIIIPYDSIISKEIALAESKRLGTEESLRERKRFSEIVELIRWNNIINEHELGKPFKTRYLFHQTINLIGPVVIIPFQFEMFIEMTLRLRYFGGFNHTLCLSNSNGTMFYLSSQNQICRGGYEVWYFIHGHTYKLVEPFQHPEIGAVCAHADPENADYSWLTKMQAAYYYMSFRILKAAESTYGVVFCCSGCSSSCSCRRAPGRSGSPRGARTPCDSPPG